MKKYILLFVTLLTFGALHNEMRADDIVYGKGDALITNVSQLSCNSDLTKEGGGLAALIDGNSSTYCHSNWTSDGLSSSTYQNLTVDLKKAVNAIYVYWMNGRTAGQAYYNDFPKDVNIYGSNDHTNWTLAKQLVGVGGSTGSEEYTSDPIVLGGSYMYLRFDIVATHSGRLSDDGVPFFCLKEFQVYEALSGKPITFSIIGSNGETVATATETEALGKTISETDIPSSIKKEYCTYTATSSLTVSSESSNNIDFTYTFDGPFNISDNTDKAHWYVLKVRQGTNSANNIVYITNSNTLGVSSSKYSSVRDAANNNDMFAFIGNPYTGFQIVSKKNPTYYLTDSSTPNMQTGEGSKWIVAKNTAQEYNKNTAFAAGFTIKLYGDNLKYLNEQGGTLTYWESENNAHDDGSNIVAFSGEDMLRADIDTLLNYKTTDVVYGFSEEDLTELNAEYSQYNTFDELNSFLTTVQNKQIPLTTGYYRIVNPREFGTNSNYVISSLDKGRYLIVKADKSLGVTHKDTAQTDYSNIFYITVNGSYQTIASQDLYLQHSGSTVSAADKGNQKSQILPFVGATDATASINLSDADGNLSNYYLLTIWNNTLSTHTTLSGHENTLQYFLVPAKEITVNMHAPSESASETYATLYVPFAVSLPDGLTAYTAVLNETKNSLTLTSVGKTIPKETPVILIGTEKSYSLTIESNYVTANQNENDLNGQYLADTKKLTYTSATDTLTLGVYDGKVGFYKYTSSTIGANKVRLNVSSSSSSKGFTFSFGDDDPTGINDTTTSGAVLKVGDVIYDLQGRRVQEAKRGIYIINGKKTLVK